MASNKSDYLLLLSVTTHLSLMSVELPTTISENNWTLQTHAAVTGLEVE